MPGSKPVVVTARLTNGVGSHSLNGRAPWRRHRGRDELQYWHNRRGCHGFCAWLFVLGLNLRHWSAGIGTSAEMSSSNKGAKDPDHTKACPPMRVVLGTDKGIERQARSTATEARQRGGRLPAGALTAPGGGGHGATGAATCEASLGSGGGEVSSPATSPSPSPGDASPARGARQAFST